MFFSEINYVAVVVGAVLHMVIGFLWYGPLFGQTWMELVGLTKEKIESAKDQMGKTYAVSFVLGIVMSAVLYWLVKSIAPFSLYDAVFFGGLLWLAFTGNAQLNNTLFLRKPLKLFLIDSGYFLVSTIVLSVLFTLW